MGLLATRVRLVLMAPLIALDCAGSVLVGESFHTTLSAKAWDARVHPRWGWTHRFIDSIFGEGHCRIQWVRETRYGGVWAAWMAMFKDNQ